MPCHHTTSFATDSNKSALIVDTPAIIYIACASLHAGHQSGSKSIFKCPGTSAPTLQLFQPCFKAQKLCKWLINPTSSMANLSLMIQWYNPIQVNMQKPYTHRQLISGNYHLLTNLLMASLTNTAAPM